MIAKVYDNLFDLPFRLKVEKHLSELPVSAINIANGESYPYGMYGSHRLFGENIFERTDINHTSNLMKDCDIYFSMLKHIEDHHEIRYYLKRIDFNLQHSFCDGTSHIDGKNGEETIMYMVNNEWDKDWSGQFQILNDDDEIIEEHEFVPGRVLIFPSHIPHRGLGPRHPYVYRYTVVWRVQELEDALESML